MILALPILALRVVPYAPTIVLPFPLYHSLVLYGKYSFLPGEILGLLCVLSVSFLTKHGVRSRIVLVSFLLLQVLPPRTYVPTMAKFSPPADMDFSTPEAWPQWKSRFSRFRVATKMNTESSAVQIATLLYSLGPSADGVFERELTFADDADRGDFDKVLAAFDAYFSPAVNVIHERTQFTRLRQLPGESICSFSSRILTSATKCQFATASENIRDHLIAHMRNMEVSKELQKADFLKLTLADVLQAAKVAETLDTQLAEQRPTEVAAVSFAGKSAKHTKHRHHQSSHSKNSSRAASSASSSQSHTRVCSGCGAQPSHQRRDCPGGGVQPATYVKE